MIVKVLKNHLGIILVTCLTPGMSGTTGYLMLCP